MVYVLLLVFVWLFCCRFVLQRLCLQQPKLGEDVLSTKQLLFYFSKEIKMPFIFSKADNVEEAKKHQRLKGKRKGHAVTTSFFRERCGMRLGVP